MGMTGVEEVLSQVISALQAGMAAKVSALNTEYGSAYTLTSPATASYLTELSDPQARSVLYPAIVVQPDTDTALDRALGNEYGTDHDIRVDVVVRHKDATTRQVLVMRYTRIIKELLGIETALACGDCVWRGTNWSLPELTMSPNDVLRDAASLFTVTTYQRP